VKRGKRYLTVLILAGAHLFVFVGSLLLAYWQRFRWNLFPPAPGEPGLGLYLPGMLALVLLWFLAFSHLGYYKSRLRLVRGSDIPLGFKGLSLGVVVAMALSFFARSTYYSRIVFALAWVDSCLLFYVQLIMLKRLQRLLVRRDWMIQRAVVIGDKEQAARVCERLREDTARGVYFVGLVTTGSPPGNPRPPPGWVGTVDELPTVLQDHHVDVAYVASSAVQHETLLGILSHCAGAGVDVHIVSDVFDIIHSAPSMEQIEGIPTVTFDQVLLRPRHQVLKRAIDLVGATIGLILLSPLFVVIAIMTKLDSRGPVFYRQWRVGKDGKKFLMYKFRSMMKNAEKEIDKLIELNEASGPLFKMKNDPRMTRMGAFLRRTSLDELPQLLNVLAGQMSLVGPRPPLPVEVEDYSEWQKARLTVRQGMTGLWQVSGRSRLSFDEMVTLDLYYIENWSLWLDIAILLRTIPIVLLAKGAY
jgi:exopolysaccharide biosynthesis polyprenyl glycosylphosphotransferase